MHKPPSFNKVSIPHCFAEDGFFRVLQLLSPHVDNLGSCTTFVVCQESVSCRKGQRPLGGVSAWKSDLSELVEGQSCTSVAKIMSTVVPNCYLTLTCSRMSFSAMGGCSLIALTQMLSPRIRLDST
jgi:hypothetical protein